MRHPVMIALLMGTTMLAACGDKQSDAEVQRAVADVNVIDESNLNDIMLTVGDPDEAVAYFQRTAAANPDRIDLKRGLAKSLSRAGRPTEAAGVLTQIVNSVEGTNEDKVSLADAQIRADVRAWEVKCLLEEFQVFGLEPPLGLKCALGLFIEGRATIDQVQTYLDSGELLHVLADWSPPFTGYHLYTPSRRPPGPALALLIEALRDKG